ncbi:MAG TPA: type II toxin-antitoxin system RelE/ParE family toxin [Thermoanaerobaculia bacterium]|jgi:plasmid stabilization system protein ParE|nr:type II toxin-antitoxin system RelE/ParE family toxin [Thermoanaerobaculia bacterium]
MKDVRFHPAADEELLESTDWYLRRSASAADGFVREIEHALARIAEAPERYPLTRFGRRRFVLLNYPFDLVYRVLPNEIEIIAVAHHARRPAYWRDR